MADSLVSVDKKCIFRETFENEQSVRRNGGVPTGSYSFSKGSFATVYGTPGYITYNIPIVSTFSVRIKVRFNTVNVTSVFFDGKRDSGYFDIYNNSNSNIASTNFTKIYINGADTLNGAFLPVINTTYDIVVTTTSAIRKFTVGGNLNGLFTPSTAIELLEIYSGLLSQEEVKNLYENKRYREVSGHGEQLGAELVTNGNFSQGNTGWNLNTGWTINNNILTGINNSTSSFSQLLNTIAGKRYKIVISFLTAVTGQVQPYVGAPVQIIDTFTPINNTTFSWTITAVNTCTYFALYGINTFNVSINYISIKEVLVNSTKPILDVCACNGVVKNKYSGDVYNELCEDTKFSNPTLWQLSANWSINNNIASCVPSAGGYLMTWNILTIGKTYKVTLDILSISNSFSLTSGWGVGNAITIATGTTGINQYTIIAGTTSMNLYAVNTSAQIKFMSIKEVIPAVIPTAVEVVKDNDVWAMKFNGGSTIDCGSYDGMTGDKTFVYWIKNRFNVLSILSDILFNTKLILSEKNTVSDCSLYFASDGASYSCSSYGALYPFLRKWRLSIVTRTSSGIQNTYVNGILNGNANQASGTPVAGTTNLVIGGSLKGLIGSVRIYDGLLTVSEISALYSNEKKLYSL